MNLRAREVMSTESEENEEVRGGEPFKAGDAGASANGFVDPIDDLLRAPSIESKPYVIPDHHQDGAEKKIDSEVAPHRIGTSRYWDATQRDGVASLQASYNPR